MKQYVKKTIYFMHADHLCNKLYPYTIHPMSIYTFESPPSSPPLGSNRGGAAPVDK